MPSEYGEREQHHIYEVEIAVQLLTEFTIITEQSSTKDKMFRVDLICELTDKDIKEKIIDKGEIL